MAIDPRPRRRSVGRDPLVVRLGLTVCRWALRWYPHGFRDRHAAAMLQGSRDLLLQEHRSRGVRGVVALLLRILRDLGAGAVGERVARPSSPSPDRLPMLESLMLDLRFARRSMARRPGLTALAVVTLALGIGASAAMFSMVDAVAFQPLDYPQPEQLMSVYVSIPEWAEHERFGQVAQRARWSYEEFEAWRERQRSFVAASLVESASGNLVGVGEAERIEIGMAGVELFSMLGAVPAQGRFFAPDDEAADGRVAVVTSEFWQQRLGGDVGALGRTLEIGGDPFTLVGVLPEGFSIHPYEADVWIPIFDSRPGGLFPGNTGDMDHVFQMIGRLDEAVSPEAAQEEAGRLLVAVNGPDHFTQHGASVIARQADQTQAYRQVLLMLLGAVLMLLLVACVNVATFLLGHAVDRQQEIAIRGALGAARHRISRQLLTESLLLAGLGGGLGLVLASAGVEFLRQLAPEGLPRIDAVSLDVRAVAFAVVAAALSGMVFGMAPALTLARSDLATALGSGRFGSSGRTRMQAGMVVAEVALATVLLVGAGLMTRSFLRLNAVDVGFEPTGVLTLSVSPAFYEFYDQEGNLDIGAVNVYYDELAASLRAVPGVDAVATTRLMPFTGSMANNNVTPEGVPEDEAARLIIERRFVSPEFLQVIGGRLVTGRFLDGDDNREDAASVIVVTESFANRFWPPGEAVGKRVGWWGQESEVVGVIGDVRDRSLAIPIEMQFYAAPRRFQNVPGNFLLRATGDPADLVDSVRAAVRTVDADLPITSLIPMEDRIAGSLASVRYRTRLIVVFAVTAAVLSILGLYGVTSRAVAGRTRELGIRLALGADSGSMVSLVLRDGVWLAAIGAALGLAVSMVGTRAIEGMLHGITRNDPITLAGIVVIVASMAALASLLPSLRASRVDPVLALRQE